MHLHILGNLFSDKILQSLRYIYTRSLRSCRDLRLSVNFFFAFIGWHTIALPWLIQLLATSKSWLQNVWWTDDLCLRLKPTCLLTMSHHGAAGASQLVTLYTRVQGCVRGRQGRGQGQGQIISDQGHVRLWNPTWLVRLHRSTPYCYSSVLTTQSFAYHYPRDAMPARVFARGACLSVCPSVCQTPVLCQNEQS